MCVYGPDDPKIAAGATALRELLAPVLRFPAAKLLYLHDDTSMESTSMEKVVIPALLSRPVVFIRTRLHHEDIPRLFTPWLLRTAAS